MAAEGLTCEVVGHTFLNFRCSHISMDGEEVMVPMRRAESEPPLKYIDVGLQDFPRQNEDPHRQHSFVGEESTTNQKQKRYSRGAQGGSLNHPGPKWNKESHSVPRRPKKSTTQNWWRHVSDTCPLSDFPINLLPFPPFSLCLDRSRNDDCHQSNVLIDGQFLAYQVMSTWDFEVLGIKLTDFDIMELDRYLKRCKLGAPRIGDAIALKKSHILEAQMQWEQMNEYARVRLREVKEIKRRRRAHIRTRCADENGEEQPSIQTHNGTSASSSSTESSKQRMGHYAGSFHPPLLLADLV